MSLVVIVQRVHQEARPVSEYRYLARVGDETLAQGFVVHERADGWLALLQRVIDDAKRREASA